MKLAHCNLALSLAVLALFIAQSTASAQDTAFTYQGQLQNNGVPASGTYNFQFTLYARVSGGLAYEGQTNDNAVVVSNGLFTVTLDFGFSPWNGQSNLLQIAVETNGATTFTMLTPMQQLTPVPYAIYAESGGTAAMLSSGVALGSGSGNSIYNQNNRSADAFIGGGQSNIIQGVAGDAFIGGGQGNIIQSGASDAFIGGGYQNTASALYAALDGGEKNSASGDYATVGGGYQNKANNEFVTIAGGEMNTASYGYATVSGGALNTASGAFATIGGGEGNIASGWGSFIGGGGFDGSGPDGIGNTNEGRAATIGGGMDNIILTSANFAFIGGGFRNSASGQAATVPGGYQNVASGNDSFAAGINAQATNDNSFVWSDGSAVTVSTTTNQFVARASGGYVLYSDNGGEGVSLAPGSGTWSMMSDRNAKNQFVPINSERVLTSVAALPMTTWSYKNEHGVRHIGPMAQDFYAAFKVGEDNRHITEVDEGGVALAAIQGLNEKVEDTSRESETRIQKLETENADLKKQNDLLAQRLNALEETVKTLAERN